MRDSTFPTYFDSINRLCSIWSDLQQYEARFIASPQYRRNSPGNGRQAGCRRSLPQDRAPDEDSGRCNHGKRGNIRANGCRRSAPAGRLIECPPATGDLLNGSAQCIDFDAGEIVFRQSGICRGLYLVVSGQFQRRTERLETRLTLGPARAGDLVELSAALGDGRHTCTLSALTPGSMLLLPMEALNQAFQSYPPLRMRLLEELAREVSRAYSTCWLNRTLRTRQRGSGATPA